MKWNREQIHSAMTEMQGVSTDENIVDALALVYKLAERDAQNQLKSLCLNIATLNKNVVLQELKEKDVKSLEQLGFSLLQVNGIEPHKSTLDFLYTELLVAVIHCQISFGNFSDAWQLLSSVPHYSKYLSQNLELECEELKAHLSIRLGNHSLVIETLKKFPIVHPEWMSIILLVGGKEQFYQNLSKLSDQRKSWWKSYQKCYANDFSEMLIKLRPKDQYRDCHRLLTAKLWIASDKSNRFEGHLPSVEWIKRTYSAELKRNITLKNLAESVALLEKSQDVEVPIVLRIRYLNEAIGLSNRVSSIEDELLIHTAASRVSYQSRQYNLCHYYLSEYKKRCYSLSDGKSNDCLHIAIDMLAAPVVTQLYRTKKREKEDPVQGAFKRRLALASLFSSGFAFWSFEKMKGQFSPKDQREYLNKKLYHQLVAKMVSRLDHLKGAAMKFGQIIAFMHPYLSKSIQEELNTVLDSGTEMPSKTVKEIFKQSLGEEPEKVFKEWHPKAVAAASIGQVHLAVSKDDVDLAVKVQYPHIKESISSDLNSFLLVQPVFRQIYPRVDLHAIISEVKKMFAEECNYEMERRQHSAFYDMFVDDPYVVIPKVYEPMNSDKIIVTEYIHGKKFVEIAGQVNQEDANHYGEVLFRFFVRSLLRGRVVYCDPNPGNFLFDGKRVCVLDFGLIKPIDENFIQSIKTLFYSSVNRDVDEFRKGISLLGLSKYANEYDYKTHFDVFMSTTARSWSRNEEFQFDSDHLRNLIEQNILLNPFGKDVYIPAEYFLIMRGYIGIESLLSSLNARSNWQKIILEELDHLEENTLHISG